MSLDNYTKIILVGVSLSIGAILGILRSKIFSSKEKNTLYYYFYAVGILILISIIACLIETWNELFNPPHWFNIIAILLAIISLLILFILTKKFLIIKHIYRTSELDPIVNDFTSKADRSEIKLFGGDLNFFGESPNQIDENQQYIKLKAMGFTRVLIMCEAPNTPTQRIRYGKILSDIKGTELRFYDPEKANLQLRGRMIKLNGSIRLLMFKRIKSKVYKLLDTDTSDADGALYNNIWELVWELAKKPSIDELNGFINLFQGN